MKMRTAKLIALGAVTALVAACQTAPAPVRSAPTYQQAIASDFLKVNRDAVNQLVAGLDLSVWGAGPVLVGTLVDVNDLNRSAPLGRTLSEQYASFMASSGFNVKEVKLRGSMFVREGTGELLLSRELQEIARNHNATLVLVGTYSAAAQHTFVSLKLVRTQDGRIIRGHDYALPNDRDVTRLLQMPR